MSDVDVRFLPVDLAGHTFQVLDLDHDAVVRRVTEDMRAGVDVYYDRRWGLTGAFCRFLLDRPEWFTGRTVFVAGAGVGLEAVVLGRLAGRIVVNDLAPASLTLAAEQLDANGVGGYRVDAGPFQDADLADVDVVVACFVVYDPATRDGMAALLERAVARGVPTLLANEDIGGFFEQVLAGAPAPVEELETVGATGRIVRVG